MIVASFCTTEVNWNAAVRKTQGGFTALIMDKHGVPMNLLQYLFHFQVNVVDKVAQIQDLLGIADGPYLALHIHTGFLGMKRGSWIFQF